MCPVCPEGVQARCDAGRDNPDLLVIAGGDGAVTGLLPVLREIDGRVGILPLGTWNLLARDLGIGQSIEADIAALTSGRPQPVDLGLLNDVPFHSNAGLGFFATMAREHPLGRAASRQTGPRADHRRIAALLAPGVVR